jgi:hypothetical protein
MKACFHPRMTHFENLSLRCLRPRGNSSYDVNDATLDAIHVRPAQNQQGGHELVDLNSGMMITQNIVHAIQVTDVVMKAVENLACKQGFKSLKFKNRHQVVAHDADWIAGVDCNCNNNDNEEHDDAECHHENKDDENKEELEVQEQIDPSKVNSITSIQFNTMIT